jgi:hypothetical protein
MGCSSREEIVEVFNALDGDADRVCELTFDVLTTPERLRTLQRLERGARRQRTPQHALINQLDARPVRRSWAARCAARWPTGCVSPRPTPAGVSLKPAILGNPLHSLSALLRCHVNHPPHHSTPPRLKLSVCQRDPLRSKTRRIAVTPTAESVAEPSLI